MASTEEALRPPPAAGRRALIEAAVRVVGDGGLRRLTYREVAREAGVTQGLVSHHFGSRAELIRAALEHASRTSLARSPIEPPPGRLEDLSAGLAERVADAPGEEAFQFEIALEARRRADLAPLAVELYDGYLEATARALDAVDVPGDPDLARLVFAAIDGLAFQQLVTGDRAGTTRSLAILHEMLAVVRDRGGERR
ncbi:MAG: TetR/AcrR family transcriptional regulator [Acidobacteria bacterium]|nr:MAG: TetR/AcrR family transcriptional regulator [Acidobacteriota bacterium]MCL4287045.1 TetR family transcriptional regulator [Thermoleophilia bacterium]GIK76366.1 MAG: TetR family transcriptional regulator [Actinomycetes bacterium]